MAKPALNFSPEIITKALATVGISEKDIQAKRDLLRFADDQDKCRKFCEVLQGPEAVAKGGVERLQRYQARAERVIRTFSGLSIPKDLDETKETYKDTNDMAKATAKKKSAESAPKTKKEAKVKSVKTTKAATKPALVVNESEPKWFSKFTRKGITFRMCQLLHRVEGENMHGGEKNAKITGATKAELLEDLTASFPAHDPKSLLTSINIEVSYLQKRLGKKITRTEDAKRGMVYSF